MWSIIGGSGFEKFDGFEVVEDLNRETPFGLASEGFKKVNVQGETLLFIPRHGSHHTLLPTEVNYRANIFALKRAGATKLMAFSAVGSLANEFAPGDMVIPNQFVDRTKGIRKASFGGDGLVAHVSLAKPVTSLLVSTLEKVKKDVDFKMHFNKSLVIIEGPYFSTKAESHLYRSWNCDIIGMTSFPEFALAREAGLAYLPCCFVTDYDCWKDDIPHVTVEEVITIMRQNNGKAFRVVEKMMELTDQALRDVNEREAGLKNALMSPKESLSPEQREWVRILTH